MSDAIEEVDSDIIDAISSDLPINDDLGLEELALLISTDRIRILEDKVEAEYKKLKEQQDKVRALNHLLKLLNQLTDKEGDLDISKNKEVKKLLKKAKELGVELDPEKTKYTNHERELLIENMRTTIDDYNTDNDLQLQMITRYTNERYETYQMVRSILKPLHEDKINKARSSSGRG